ncbi:hypothetical protein [Aeoliella mucimassa]|uniref:Uncharacterized protein n=1 Tax=Aeoliella mucimassa TaxID=2527972 RepID=A0A518ARK9_9BACT|nr:hypothetical protein [Aeoliella mucimassa]QDU57344.1 hypothetical protein Pan181_35590 [Aeoliella mucimassa]
MLSWFRSKPSCPVDEASKRWIEHRFSWLTDQFGINRLLDAPIVIPTEEFLPLKYECTEEGIRHLMCLVASYMDVEPGCLKLGFYDDTKPHFEGMVHSGTAGLYVQSEEGKFDIWLEINSLADPASVVGTLSHEVGHVLLLGQNRISPEEEDHEPLTDLLTVYLGLGIFQANSVVHEAIWRQGHYSGWSMGRRGYLSMDMYGYAMALYTLARKDASPDWMVHLRPDVKGALKRGIRYILETKDCEYQPALQS